jgi:hypothetical protein
MTRYHHGGQQPVGYACLGPDSAGYCRWVWFGNYNVVARIETECTV